jgi:hypothetical protein
VSLDGFAFQACAIDHSANVDHVTSSLNSSMRMTPKARRPIYRTRTSTSCSAPRAITPLTTWSAIRDEALTCALLYYPRSDLNPARSSSVKIFGCSRAAK